MSPEVQNLIAQCLQRLCDEDGSDWPMSRKCPLELCSIEQTIYSEWHYRLQRCRAHGHPRLTAVLSEKTDPSSTIATSQRWLRSHRDDLHMVAKETNNHWTEVTKTEMVSTVDDDACSASIRKRTRNTKGLEHSSRQRHVFIHIHATSVQFGGNLRISKISNDAIS